MSYLNLLCHVIFKLHRRRQLLGIKYQGILICVKHLHGAYRGTVGALNITVTTMVILMETS